jgi:hypothetical protein
MGMTNSFALEAEGPEFETGAEDIVDAGEVAREYSTVSATRSQTMAGRGNSIKGLRARARCSAAGGELLHLRGWRCGARA